MAVMSRLPLILAASAFLVTACSGTAAATVASRIPVSTPTDVRATTEPSAGNRLSLPPDAPAIADPYWLLAGGADTLTVGDADGRVIQTTNGVTYHVIEGGGMEGTILVNGIDRALLGENTTTGTEPIAGINVIETQYGVQIDDVLPDPSLPLTSPSPDDPDIWTRTTEVRGGITVYLRTADGPQGASAEAYWWGNADGGQWFVLGMQSGQDGFDEILTALLGPTD